MKFLIACWVTLLPLAAQAPPGWYQRTALGSDVPGQGAWYGGGLWAGDHHAFAPTLTDSLGLGNAITGGGFHLELGYRKGPWDMAAEGLGNRNPAGQSYITLYRSHLWYRGDHGWQGGFEQEPLVWGYGLNGGYLLGEAARPFPRLRVESPMADLRILGVPLGRWGWQAFMGRMENHPVVSSSIQNPSFTDRAIASGGTPVAPFLMGYRIQAEFGPLMEFYLNLVDLWGGTLNGRSMIQGYNAVDLATAMLGIKDGLTEANSDYAAGAAVPTSAPTKAVSASEIDVGFRLQTPALARAAGAESSYLYVSRGSKSAAWPIGVFFQRPAHYLGKDISFDVSNLSKGHLGTWWTSQYRYTAPTIQQPNDTVGVLVDWSRVRAGLGLEPAVHPEPLAGVLPHPVLEPGGHPLGGAPGVPLGVSGPGRVERRVGGDDQGPVGLDPAGNGQDREVELDRQHPGGAEGGGPAPQELDEDAAGHGVLVQQETEELALLQGLDDPAQGAALGDDRIAELHPERLQPGFQQGVVQFPADGGQLPAAQAHGEGQVLPVADVPGQADDPLALPERGFQVFLALDPGEPADLLRGGLQQAQGGEQQGPEVLEAGPGHLLDGRFVQTQVGAAQVLPHHPAVPGVDPVEQPPHGAPQLPGGLPGQGGHQRLDHQEEAELKAMSKGGAAGSGHGPSMPQAPSATFPAAAPCISRATNDTLISYSQG